MDVTKFPDSFENARSSKGYEDIVDAGENVRMVLGLKDVRKCAHNWKSFSSKSVPGRIIVPSEVRIRDVRQLPLEVDPPEHKDYRSLLEGWFKRPLEPGYQKKLEQLTHDLLDEALAQESVEVVEDFSLKLQSRALTVLLNVPFDEADTWIGWGTHVFRSDGLELDNEKAAILDNYILEQIDKAAGNPGDDLYSVLLSSEIQGRKLTREEVHGIMNLTFAGGRDTVINFMTNSIAYFSKNLQVLEQIASDPERLNKAVEELVRYFTPLTQLARIATTETEICGQKIVGNSKVSLCWASANRDSNVFESPNDIVLDRKLNPHVGFGFGHHSCLGATHARQLMKVLIKALSEKIGAMDIVSAKENIEELQKFRRKVGFDSLRVAFRPK